jgi:hypothetical protein
VRNPMVNRALTSPPLWWRKPFNGRHFRAASLST